MPKALHVAEPAGFLLGHRHGDRMAAEVRHGVADVVQERPASAHPRPAGTRPAARCPPARTGTWPPAWSGPGQRTRSPRTSRGWCRGGAMGMVSISLDRGSPAPASVAAWSLSCRAGSCAPDRDDQRLDVQPRCRLRLPAGSPGRTRNRNARSLHQGGPGPASGGALGFQDDPGTARERPSGWVPRWRPGGGQPADGQVDAVCETMR